VPSTATKAASQKEGTGFVANVGGDTQIVTALHVIAGCGNVEVEHASAIQNVSVEHTSFASDIALLSVPERLLSVPALELNTAGVPDGSAIGIVGFLNGNIELAPGLTKAPMSNTTSNTLEGILQSQDLVNLFRFQGFPSTSLRVLKTHLNIPPRASGSPIIDVDGKVVAVGNGALSGTSFYSWAVPSTQVAGTARNTARLPSASSVVAELLNQGLSAGTAGSPTTTQGSTNTVTCGDGSFSQIATDKFFNLMATADLLSQTQVLFATQSPSGSLIHPDQEYDVYANFDTGASFALPAGLKLSTHGKTCLAIYDHGRLELTVTLRNIRSNNPAQRGKEVQTLAREFAFSGLSASEQLEMAPFPTTMTTTMTRTDGMDVQRVNFLIRDSSPTAARYSDLLVLSNATHGDAYLGVALKVDKNVAQPPPNEIVSQVSVFTAAFGRQ
jgi:Trypsin-like peptidase domain